MCGICGKISPDRTSVTEAGIVTMRDTMTHRGPDDAGVWVNPQAAPGAVGLGHRRLSIIDTSSAGRQPMFSEDGRVGVVFNGEIYDYRVLRAELERLGHRFRSDSDTEVLVHWYEQFGLDGMDRLNGMFAIAVWDSRQDRLILIRDRLGIKPLVYAWDGRTLVFASEIKAVLADPAVSRAIDWEAIGLYFRWNVIPAPWTAFRQIRKLPPGHRLVLADGQIDVASYWDLADHADPEAGLLPPSDQRERLAQLLTRAVERRMIADVPLGAFLSGGIDSSIIVGLMARQSTQPVQTFCIGYPELPLYDESPYAQMVARHHGTDHHRIPVAAADVFEALNAVLDALDEPFADSSAVPTYLVSARTRQSVTVALAGDGADELFAGYRKYTGEYWRLWWTRVPAGLRHPLAAAALRWLPESRDSAWSEQLRRVKKFLRGAEQPLAGRVSAWRDIFPAVLIDTLVRPALALRMTSGGADRLIAQTLDRFAGDDINRILFADTVDSLPNDMLTKVDWMSMRHGLEVRVPFLDHEVVSFVFGLPGHRKLDGRRRKQLLMETFSDLLPPAVRTRAKWGFEIPIGPWLKGELRFLVDRFLGETFIRRQNVFDFAAIDRLVAEHMGGRVDRAYLLWNLIVFNHWWSRMDLGSCLDGEAVS